MKLYQHPDTPTTFVVIGSDLKRRQILDWVISNFSSVWVKPNKDVDNSIPSVSDMFFTSEEDAILLKMQCEILYFKGESKWLKNS